MAWTYPPIQPVLPPSNIGEDIFAHPFPNNRPTLLSIRKEPVSTLTQQGPYTTNESHYYILEFSEPFNNSIDLITEPLIPQWGTHMEGNPKLFVVDYRINQDRDAPQCYRLEVIYANSYTNAGLLRLANQFQAIPEPLKRTAEVKWGTYRTSEVISKDLNGKPLTTTAGEPIIHGEEVSRRVFHVQMNVQAISPIFANGGDFMNQDRVIVRTPAGPVIYEPYTLWLTDISMGQEELVDSVFIYPFSFSVFHREETWIIKKRNVGYMQLFPVPYPRTINLSATVGGQNVNTPVTVIDYRLTYMPIRVGNPPQITRTPLPLRNTTDTHPQFGYSLNGTLFPEYLALDPTTGQRIDPTKVTLTPDRLKEIWDEAEVTFVTKKSIYFSSTSKLQKAPGSLSRAYGEPLPPPIVVPIIQSPINDGVFFPAPPAPINNAINPGSQNPTGP